MAESKVRRVTNVTINFCDRDFKNGLRSDVHRDLIDMKGNPSEKLLGRLRKKNGKLSLGGDHPMGSADKGVLTYQLPDHYNGTDIELRINDNSGNKKEIQAGKSTAELSCSYKSKKTANTSNISEFTEFMIIKTYFEGESDPEVGLYPASRSNAVFKNPKYGSASIPIAGSEYWECVDMYYHVQDPEYENYISGNQFSYLRPKADAEIAFADEMFETSPACFGGGGSGRLKLAAAEGLIDMILAIDKKYKELAEHNKANPVKYSQEELSELAAKLLAAKAKK